MALTPLQQEFVLHFGEMGSRWGINRTVGQMYALLFLADEPLCADDFVGALGISRSNVSMGLKELQGWRLVRTSRRDGDRRDYFSTPDDLWDIVRILVEERKRREIDPTLTTLRALEMERPSKDDKAAHARIAELRALIEDLTNFYDELNKLETDRLLALMRMGSRLQSLFKGATSVLPLTRSKKG